MPKKLSSYSPIELTSFKEQVIKIAQHGLNLKSISDITSVPISQIQRLLDIDAEFNDSYAQARAQSMEHASSKMHELAQRGNYQALAFLLSRDLNSPYRDDAQRLDPKELEYLERIVGYMVENNGLLPVSHLCPWCQHELNAAPAQIELVKEMEQSTNG